MKNSTKAPDVRIGVLQSTDKVEFLCNEIFHLQNENGERLFKGVPDQKFSLTISTSKPAEINYQVRAGIEKDRTIAQDRAADLMKKGLTVEIREVGVSFELNDQEIDNKEYWIAIGNFQLYAEALQFKNDQADSGEYVVIQKIKKQAEGSIELNGKNMGATVRIVPENHKDSTCITVSNVIIGIEFHWQKFEDLDYRGIIEVGLNNQGKLAVINEIDMESYLTSVNSSEMTPDCPLGLLEAQTVAARSTVFATMGKHHYNTNFHLCSDDHCQCYHGKKREQQPSQQAVKNTWGQVIKFEDEICDARYSKICGGIMEAYHDVWENINIPYMTSGIDSDNKIEFPANTEDKARQLIDTKVPAYCNTDLYPLPPKLAGLYSTKNLFRWEVSYARQEIEELILEKTGEDIGEFLDIVPLERGDSGRLIYIELVGTKKKLKIGKELEIRRALSKSHLYSSCFYVEKEIGSDGRAVQFILKGAGWGHGVGLCQVGATVMAMKGISYVDILVHYYKGVRLEKLY
ncbi:SpoIID/LytB domain-containing protein [candidate division KSB1 bacterium]|nr:SpoIID/LytB domain-containing protein [candidate division KSB1 bacterium]